MRGRSQDAVREFRRFREYFGDYQRRCSSWTTPVCR